MTRAKVVQTLYRGGQAAIFAEIMVILGSFVLLLGNRDLIAANSVTRDSFENYRLLLDMVDRHPFAYLLGTAMFSFVPTLAMAFVIWAWHLYFASEGVEYMHWVATGLGLAGMTLMLLFAGMDISLMPALSNAIERGEITYAQAFPTLSIIGGIFDVGSTVLYGGYPMVLLLTAWQKRLLPYWFIAPGAIFVMLNDTNLILGYRYQVISDLANLATVLWPFLMGVVLLRKAQILAKISYTERHGTPPTPTSHPTL